MDCLHKICIFLQYGYFSLRHISFVLGRMSFTFFRKTPEDLLNVLLFLPSGILGHPGPISLPWWLGPGRTSRDSLCALLMSTLRMYFLGSQMFFKSEAEGFSTGSWDPHFCQGRDSNLTLSPQAFMCVLKDFTSISGLKPSCPGPPLQVLSAMPQVALYFLCDWISGSVLLFWEGFYSVWKAFVSPLQVLLLR